MPKNRSTSGGPLRTHSRSSSATRLGANLHFTAAAAPSAAAPAAGNQGKKSTNGPPETRPNFTRANSSGRVHSREQVAKRLAPLQQYPQRDKPAGKGFSLHSGPKDRGDKTPKAAAAAVMTSAAEDEDEWESSESGAVTPAQAESGSDTASDEGPAPGIMQAQVADPQAQALAHQQYLEQQQLFRQQQQDHADEQEARQVFLEQQQRQQEMIVLQQQKMEQERHLLRQQQRLQEQQRQQEELALQQQQQQQRNPKDAIDFGLVSLWQEHQQKQRQQHKPQVQTGFLIDDTAALARVNTARPSDFKPPPRLETLAPAQRQQQQQQYQQYPRQQAYPHLAQVERTAAVQERRPHTPRLESEPLSTTTTGTRSSDTTAIGAAGGEARHSPRPMTTRTSRPPSSHSMRSDQHHALRPHPLFRGISHHAGTSGAVPKPPPLAPLTVFPADGAEASSASPTTSILDGLRFGGSASPTSADDEPPHSAGGAGFRSVMAAGGSAGVSAHENARRRLSLSSARSTASMGSSSLPHSAAAAVAAAFMGSLANGTGGGGGSGSVVPWTHDRTRTLSTMSASSSSTALSALANLPGSAAAAASTRPASPQPVVFFPPINPHANVEAIHPLLPGPYLHNHLTVLARRTPIRESFDRVVYAKNAVR